MNVVEFITTISSSEVLVMDGLKYFNPNDFRELYESSVESVSAVILYYVHTGRNAWHATWLARYAEGCLHSTLDSAKKYAETRRVQGTVLHIDELPSLAFRSRSGCLIISQINTNNPLSEYSVKATSSEANFGYRKIDGALDSYICRDAPIVGVALSFECKSRFWLKEPPTSNSVILVSTKDPSFLLQDIPKRNLIARKSYSHGKKYLLGWLEKESRLHWEGVCEIASKF